MTKITEIMNMLDWSMPLDIQMKGRNLAKKVQNIAPFLQPLTGLYNKNVWDNCALVLSERSDGELEPYLSKLLEWLQDMNWPGALCIFDRLKKFSSYDFLLDSIRISIEKARKYNDEIWECNLNTLVEIIK